MQQYIYGNFEKKSYQYRFSEEMTDENRKMLEGNIGSLNRFYDSASIRGGYGKSEEPVSFLYLCTDFGNPKRRAKLFFQQIGCDPERKGYYIHGIYVDRDGFDFDISFMEAMTSRFMNLKKTHEMARERLGPVIEMNRIEQQAIFISEEVTCRILYYLMNRKKILISLDRDGPSAQAYARNLLVSIYEKLPYPLRRANGCLTGCTRGMLEDSNLSPGLSIFVAEKSSGIVEAMSGVNVIDLEDTVAEPVPGSDSEKEFLHFLCHNENDRAAFFKELNDMKGKESGTIGDLAAYTAVYQFWKKSVSEKEKDSKALNRWIQIIRKCKKGSEPYNYLMRQQFQESAFVEFFQEVKDCFLKDGEFVLPESKQQCDDVRLVDELAGNVLETDVRKHLAGCVAGELLQAAGEQAVGQEEWSENQINILKGCEKSLCSGLEKLVVEQIIEMLSCNIEEIRRKKAEEQKRQEEEEHTREEESAQTADALGNGAGKTECKRDCYDNFTAWFLFLGIVVTGLPIPVGSLINQIFYWDLTTVNLLWTLGLMAGTLLIDRRLNQRGKQGSFLREIRCGCLPGAFLTAVLIVWHYLGMEG